MTMEHLVQFGVAGLMGALWIWERTHSRRREAQLTEAHGRLMEQQRHLSVLVKTVRQNTRAIVSFEKLLTRTCDVLDRHDRRDAA
jgi:hypothetical protein